MKYVSTRGQSDSVTAAEAILRGIAPDGGLYCPESIPAIGADFIAKLCNMDYNRRAAAVLSLFMEDFSEEQLLTEATAAYSTFDEYGVAPLAKLGDQCSIMELWHGPTCAFKDVALQMLPRLLRMSKEQLGVDEETCILVATSGDTGKAALEGFKDAPGVSVTVFYPNQGVSVVQRTQMVTQQGNNVHVAAVEGNFDDAQTGVKKIFGDRDFAEELASRGQKLSSANSINWGRLAPQIVYYFSAYADMVNSGSIRAGDKVNFCVPTGNFGDILAGWYAKAMGLPVNKLICASNANKVLTEFFETGTYNKNREFFKTGSPSMDILISSNMERMLYHVTGSATTVAELMAQLNTEGSYTLDNTSMEALRRDYAAGYADDATCAATIKEIFDTYSYVCDTHTAVAYAVYKDYVAQTGDETTTVVLSTASPFKFVGFVLSSLTGADNNNVSEFQLLRELSDVSGDRIPAPLRDLETRQVLHSTLCDKEDMKKTVNDFLER